MPDHEQPRPPRNLSGYLDALSRVVFQTGISWRVVESKWPGIRDAFDGFDPETVAAMGEADIDRLMADRRVIRNRRKVEAIASNARRMLDLDAEYHGFGRYLDSLGNFEDTRKDLRRQFAFVGDSGAWFFLWLVGRTVPEHAQTQ